MDTLIAGHSQLKGVRELLLNHPTVSVSCHPGRRTEELFALVEEVLPSCEVMYYDKTTPAMLWLCKHLRSPSAFCRYIIMHKYEPLFINRTVGASCQNVRVLPSCSHALFQRGQRVGETVEEWATGRCRPSRFVTKIALGDSRLVFKCKCVCTCKCKCGICICICIWMPRGGRICICTCIWIVDICICTCIWFKCIWLDSNAIQMPIKCDLNVT